jgi:hypothetical protein
MNEGAWGIEVSSLILNLSTRWRLVDSLIPRSLYARGNSLRYSLNWRLGVLHKRNICSLKRPNFIVKVLKFRMKCAVAGTGKATDAYRIMVGKTYWETPIW